MTEHSENKKIRESIIVFYQQKSGRFHGYELLNFCINRGVKPTIYMDTMLRVMRQLRQDNVINYKLVGRSSDSLYEIVKKE